MGFRVVAPLVYLRVPDSGGAYVSYTFYAGAPVPDNVDPASLKHHLESGLVVADADPVVIVAVPAGSPIPGEPPNVPVGDSVLSEPVEDRTVRLRAGLPKPAANAPKAVWVDYAISQGVPADEAEALSKADLQDRF